MQLLWQKLYCRSYCINCQCWKVFLVPTQWKDISQINGGAGKTVWECRRRFGNSGCFDCCGVGSDQSARNNGRPAALLMSNTLRCVTKRHSKCILYLLYSIRMSKIENEERQRSPHKSTVCPKCPNMGVAGCIYSKPHWKHVESHDLVFCWGRQEKLSQTPLCNFP